jgi:CheY-like chemotaxis protein
VSSEIIIEFVKIVPSVLWFIFVSVLIIRLYEPIRDELLPRVSGFKAFGVEATFIADELKKAAEERETELSEEARSSVERRLQRAAPLLRGVQILWVDDDPSNIIYEARILRSFDVSIDIVISTLQALSALSRNSYDLVISDIARDEIPDEGLRFLREMRNRGLFRPTVLYAGAIDWEKGTPPYAFGITNRVDDLLHYVMDIVERRKG